MDYMKKVDGIIGTLSAVRVVPVLVLENLDDGLRMCETLLENGLPAAEVTFRTTAAAAVIQAAATRFPELLLGAGTVLNVENLQRAIDAGARFAVAPGCNPTVVKAAIARGLPFAPGVCTPSEAEIALELGCRLLKFFPAEAAGGVKFLSSMLAPYRHLGVRVMPTGGINTANLADYLKVKEVVAVGGTWIGKAADIAEGNWEKIAALVKEAVQLARDGAAASK